MKIKAGNFFSPDEKAGIKQAVEKAEYSTSGEIAVMVVDESDSYREAITLGAIVSAAFFALALEIIAALILYSNSLWTSSSAWSFPEMISSIKDTITVWTYIPLTFILFFPLKYIFMKFPGFKIRFMSKKRIEETVSERAVRAFYEKGLYRTRDETGILIFISLLEHKVWILGDRGINAKIPDGFWMEYTDELVRGIKTQRQGKVVLDVIEKCGLELSKHFPRKPDDRNELSDEVIV